MPTRVMLVDDEADYVLQKSLGLLVKEHGFQVTSCVDPGRVPWDEVARADLVLVDYYLSGDQWKGPTGVDFLRELRARQPAFDGEIVLLSVVEDLADEVWQECLALGVSDFLSKMTPAVVLTRKLACLVQARTDRLRVSELERRLVPAEPAEPGVSGGSLSLPNLRALFAADDERRQLLSAVLHGGPVARRNVNRLLLLALDRALGRLAERLGPLRPPQVRIAAARSLAGVSPVGSDPASPANTDGELAVPGGVPLRLVEMVGDGTPESRERAIADLFAGDAHEAAMDALLLRALEAVYDLAEVGQ